MACIVDCSKYPSKYDIAYGCDYKKIKLIFHPTNSKKGIAVVGNLRVELK